MIKIIVALLLYFFFLFFISIIGGIAGFAIGVNPRFNNGGPAPGGIAFAAAGFVIGFSGGIMTGLGLCIWKRFVYHDPSPLITAGLVFNGILAILILSGIVFLCLSHSIGYIAD